MLSGGGGGVLRWSSAAPAIFLARQPSDMAKSWGNCSLDLLVPSSICACPFGAKTQDLLSTCSSGVWEHVWVSGRRASRLLPCFSCNPRELELGCVGLSPLIVCPERLYLMQTVSLGYNTFSDVSWVWLGYHLTITRPGRKVWLHVFFSFSF